MKISKIVKDSKIIAEKVKVLEHTAGKMKGLMFSRKLRDDEALVFVNNKESVHNSSLHMFFVFYKIDIVWLSKNMEIVDLRNGALPFTPLIIPKKAAKYIIEMKSGKIKENKLEIGNRIKFL